MKNLTDMNIGELSRSVQANCHISDAKYAGNYSMCVFLLKMREYFRWEQQIPLSHALDKTAVSQWLLQREQMWNDLEDLDYSPITIGSESFDPFDSVSINKILVPQGYIYSSGYGLFGKPHFFLGQLKRVVHQGDIRIYISEQELARDLVAPSAMSLNNVIYIREESLRRYIWEKIEEWQWKKDRNHPMAKALDCIGDQNMELVLDRLCENECENVLLHEIGETEAGQIVGQAWKDMLHHIPRSGAELQIRSVRDHLADCISTLPALLNSNNALSLHFYFANFTGMRKQLFPGIWAAYHDWSKSGDTKSLTESIARGREHWENTAHSLLAAYKKYGTAITQRTDELIQAI